MWLALLSLVSVSIFLNIRSLKKSLNECLLKSLFIYICYRITMILFLSFERNINVLSIEFIASHQRPMPWVVFHFHTSAHDCKFSGFYPLGNYNPFSCLSVNPELKYFLYMNVSVGEWFRKDEDMALNSSLHNICKVLISS